MASPDLEDLKYHRFGYTDLGRPCDEIATAAKLECPGQGVLPDRWAYISESKFLKKYGDLGDVLWSKSVNYHLLVIKGKRLFKIWTNTTGTRGTVLSFHSDLLGVMTGNGLVARVVPAGAKPKHSPFTYCSKIKEPEKMKQIMKDIGRLYGLDLKRL